MNRRAFLQGMGDCWMAGVLARGALRAAASPLRNTRLVVDRRARVDRHAPVVRRFDPLAALSVGNGGFAFTADATGMQSFPELYHDIPLCTQAEWGWHSFPNKAAYRLADATVLYDAHGRRVPYASAQGSAAGEWLRVNPHRLSLARVGLALHARDGALAKPSDVQDIVQRLDLWSGTLESRFRVDGRPVRVLTCVHPERDLIAARIEATDMDASWVSVRIAFPYVSAVHTGDPAEWSHAEAHRTEIVERSKAAVSWRRVLDEDTYSVRAAWSDHADLAQHGAHSFVVRPASGARNLEAVVAFSPDELPGTLPSVQETLDAVADHWRDFWTTGGVVDLDASSDMRARELERRIVLSEYLTATQCAGHLPPQETGETFDSWYGKFHLEMHWWHAAHFALWGREALLERSLPWYSRILPTARETARQQGYAGARWPKMVGPDGRESPSGVGVFLIWQQPHPIYLAELVYRARPDRRVLDAYREVVFESASFMSSYPAWDAASRSYVLGPPLIPAQESHPPATTFNPTFELAYWAFGLQTAQRWRERLGLARDARWDDVISRLSPLPMRDGLYVNTESAPTTWSDAEQRRDHPTLLGAFGFVASPRVDRDAMRRTLRRTLESWRWNETWGWDFPLVAMTAARLGEPELAVDALLMDTPKNRYLPNGHNHQRPGLTIYLPGNGALLAAVAMMAAGWDGAPGTHAPGFPVSSRGWVVAWEGLRPLP